MMKIMGQLDCGLLRKIISLALLPPEIITITFNELKSKYETNENSRFFLYVEKEWLRKVLIFKTNLRLILNN